MSGRATTGDTNVVRRADTEEAPGPWDKKRFQVLDDFIYAEVEAAEDIRLRYCLVCQRSAASNDSEAHRLALCDFHRCGLRDPVKFVNERTWIFAARTALQDMDHPNPAVVNGINEHVLKTGAVTPALSTEGDGRLGLGSHQVTLRGAVHEALLQWVVVLAGEVRINLFSLDANQARRLFGRMRAQFRRLRSEWQRDQAARLRAEGVSDYAIAKQLGVTHKTIRDWLGDRKDWEQGH